MQWDMEGGFQMLAHVAVEACADEALQVGVRGEGCGDGIVKDEEGRWGCEVQGSKDVRVAGNEL